MALQNKLKPLLHRKAWEGVTPSPAANANGAFIVTADMGTGLLRVFEMTALAQFYAYYGAEDAHIQLPNLTVGSFGSGTCAEWHPNGPNFNALAGGTTTTILTALTLARDLRGHRVRVQDGPGAVGAEFIIASNTIGPNAAVTLTTPMSAVPTTATVVTLRTGRLWVLTGNATTPTLSFFDWATNAWTVGRSIAGLPATWGTDGQLVSTNSLSSGTLSSPTITASGATANTITTATTPWVANTWANRGQVRVLTGAGAGQVRRIASNTNNTLTLTANWTTNPDATSTFLIEGDDDSLYLFGNAQTPAYRYSISGNTWTTIAPVTARTGAPTTCALADIPNGVTDPLWAAVGDPLNCRRIYSPRGSGAATMDYFDIAANTWVNDLNYGNRNETLTTGTNSVVDQERIYYQKDSTNRLFYFDVVLGAMRPFSTLLYGVGGTSTGDKMAVVKFKEAGSPDLPFLYFRRSLGVEYFRTIIIK